MPRLNFLLLMLCVGVAQIGQSAERKAVIGSAPPSLDSPVIGYFVSTNGERVVIEGISGAAHARRIREIPELTASEDSQMSLVTTSNGVYLRTADGQRLLMSGIATAAAFLPNRTDAVVAIDDQIYLLDLSGGAKFLARESAVALAVSGDGRIAVLLNNGGSEAAVLDLQTSATRHLQLGAVARSVQRARDGVFIFVPQHGMSPWLFDANSGALSFAPELPSAAVERAPR
jgi:hypothetical protein